MSIYNGDLKLLVTNRVFEHDWALGDVEAIANTELKISPSFRAES